MSSFVGAILGILIGMVIGSVVSVLIGDWLYYVKEYQYHICTRSQIAIYSLILMGMSLFGWYFL